jgi:hypothetical protein
MVEGKGCLQWLKKFFNVNSLQSLPIERERLRCSNIWNKKMARTSMKNG